MSDSTPLAVITGASSGIGLELAKLLGRDGYRLLMTARASQRFDGAVEQLRPIAKGGVEMHADDLTDPAAAGRIMSAVGDRPVDVLINNAGFGTHGPFAESDAQQQLDMVQVNVSMLVHLTRLMLPGMIARRTGRIMNVSSTASFQPGPYMATYYATKAFVTSFSRAVNYEIRGKAVTVTTVCPGPTDTDFQNRAGVANSPLFQNNTMTAAAVAQIGYDGMRAGKPVVITGAKNRMLALASKFSPTRLTTRIAGKLNADR